MAVALLTVVVLAAGCSSWSQTSIRPQASASEKLPGLLRLHLKDGRTLQLVDARVVGDSLVGVLEARRPVGARHADRSGQEKVRAAVALADIQSAEKDQTDPAKTILAGLCVIAVFATAVAFSGMGPIGW